MLKSLKYSVEFPNGKKLSADLVFSGGMTAISGRNEAGKSMVLEMVRYGLFGTAALRGKSSDYKKLNMSLTFVVKGEEYTVVRTASKADLTNSAGPVATGTKPVNQHIVSLFGYDLAVFDTANNCAQGEIERLSTMKPSERKALVDQTVGLNVIDDLIQSCASEIEAERKAYEALMWVLSEPTMPEKPEGYAPSGTIQPEYESYRELLNELNSLRGWVQSASGRHEPVAPPPAPVSETSEELQRHEEQREQNDRLLNELQRRLSAIPESALKGEELNAALEVQAHNKKVAERQALEQANPLPPLTSQEIEKADLALNAKQLQADIARLEASGRISCPACGTDFAHEHNSIVTLTAELISLGPIEYELAEKYDRRVLDRYMNQLDARRRVQAQIDALPDTVLLQAYSDNEILLAVHASMQEEHADSLRKAISEIETLPSRRADLIARAAWEREVARYERDAEDWRKFSAQLTEKRERLMRLEGLNVPEKVSSLETQLESSRGYEAAHAVYVSQLKTYLENKAVADQHKENVEDLSRARKALRELKIKIKGYLLPSLNRVASSLLSAMTGGERNTINIDEDFEITVDDQPISTLSGSGKAVANLAIRLGLGQVLTNKVFSVFMADEIDAAMDANRANFTAECLSRLTKNIGQVILVSHKTINAMHHIVLGSTPNEVTEPVEFSEGAH